MKRSDCYPCAQLSDDGSYRCRFIDKQIRSIKKCPKAIEDNKEWTPEEYKRLIRLSGSGTHLRNVAIILGRPYLEIVDALNDNGFNVE